MKTLTPYLSLVLILSIISCQKKTDIFLASKEECENFKEALILHQNEILRAQIDLMLKDLLPQPTSQDLIGHAQNLDILIKRLSNDCDAFQVSLQCYSCVYTLPPISELRFVVDSAGISIERTMDLFTPEAKVMGFVGIH